MATGTLDRRTERLARVVSRTRAGIVATVLAAGLLLATACAIGWVLGGVVLDLVAPLPVAGRVAVWCGWWLVVAAATAAFLLLPAWRRPVLDAVALRIERALGGIHNRLLTVVDLARRGRAGSTAGIDTSHDRFRPELVERLLDQTQDRLRGFRASRVLPWRAVARNLAVVAGIVAAVAGMYVGFGERFLVTLQRLVDPTADIPPATWLVLEPPGDLEVLEREPFAIDARVARGEVEEVSLVLFDDLGHPRRQPMRADGAGSFVAAIDGLDRPTRYRLEGGNTWTRTHAIRLLKRPEIRSLARSVHLPDYMRIDRPLPVADDAARISAPEGSTVEFEATASAEAAEGSVRLFQRSIETTLVERVDERIWFEDDLPRDAVCETPWRWTTSQAAGGLRGFTCGADRPMVAMRTRLEPFVLPKERHDSRSLSVMARLDPTDPPAAVSLRLDHDRGRTVVIWGDAAKAAPVSNAARVVAGPLPAPGEWARLTAPMRLLAPIAGKPISGAAFSVDRGRAVFDRPGWVDRTQERVKQPVDRPAGAIPLVRSEGGDPSEEAAWLGRVPVEKPVWATIEFRSVQGHASLPVPPVEIVPTVDRPPSIVVDTMPETLTLQVADDVPVTGRGFDDWGIDQVSVRIGPDADRLGPPEPLAGVSMPDRPPATQIAIATSIPSERLGLGPGRSAAWQLQIRDTKGQVAETPVFRVTVVMPPERELAKSQVPALEQAKRQAEDVARKAQDPRAEEIDRKQESVREAMAREQEPDKKDVEQVADALERERTDAERLARTLEAAAAQAAKSDLVQPREKERIADLAAKAKALEQELAGEKQDPAEKAERVAKAPSQKAVAEAARDLAEAIEETEQRLDAQGAAMQLESLAEDLDRRAESLAEAEAAADRSASERKETREQVAAVEQILGERFPEPKPPAAPRPKPDASPAGKQAAQAAADDGQPPAVPPQPSQAPPQPSAAEAAAEAAAASAETAAALASKLAPREPPDPAVPPAHADPKPAPENDPPAAEGAPLAPPSASEADRLESLLDSEEVREALAMADRARRIQAREAAMAEAAARREAAERARLQAQADRSPGSGDEVAAKEESTDPSGPSEGGSVSGQAELAEADSLRGLDAQQRAAIYKLPPRVRDPLLEGMRQRGPAAYQGVIDTYFRQLGRDIPE